MLDNVHEKILVSISTRNNTKKQLPCFPSLLVCELVISKLSVIIGLQNNSRALPKSSRDSQIQVWCISSYIRHDFYKMIDLDLTNCMNAQLMIITMKNTYIIQWLFSITYRHYFQNKFQLQCKTIFPAIFLQFNP